MWVALLRGFIQAVCVASSVLCDTDVRDEQIVCFLVECSVIFHCGAQSLSSLLETLLVFSVSSLIVNDLF